MHLRKSWQPPSWRSNRLVSQSAMLKENTAYGYRSATYNTYSLDRLSFGLEFDFNAKKSSRALSLTGHSASQIHPVYMQLTIIVLIRRWFTLDFVYNAILRWIKWLRNPVSDNPVTTPNSNTSCQWRFINTPSQWQLVVLVWNSVLCFAKTKRISNTPVCDNFISAFGTMCVTLYPDVEIKQHTKSMTTSFLRV